MLPFRDAATTLSDCLDSIAAQTATDHEVVALGYRVGRDYLHVG